MTMCNKVNMTRFYHISVGDVVELLLEYRAQSLPVQVCPVTSVLVK